MNEKPVKIKISSASHPVLKLTQIYSQNLIPALCFPRLLLLCEQMYISHLRDEALQGKPTNLWSLWEFIDMRNICPSLCFPQERADKQVLASAAQFREQVGNAFAYIQLPAAAQWGLSRSPSGILGLFFVLA